MTTPSPEPRERLIATMKAWCETLDEGWLGSMADALIASGYLHRDEAMGAVAKWHDEQIALLRADEKINTTRDWPRATQSYLTEIQFHSNAAAALRQRSTPRTGETK